MESCPANVNAVSSMLSSLSRYCLSGTERMALYNSNVTSPSINTTRYFSFSLPNQILHKHKISTTMPFEEMCWSSHIGRSTYVFATEGSHILKVCLTDSYSSSEVELVREAIGSDAG